MRFAVVFVVLGFTMASEVKNVSGVPRVFNIGTDEFLTRLASTIDDRINFLLDFMIPQMPDIMPLDGPINLSVPGLINMEGRIKDAFVTGIPKTKAHIGLDTKDPTLTFALSNEYMKLFGREYDITGLLLLNGVRFNGSGIAAAELKNFDLFLSTKLVVDPVEDKLTISKTNINLSFESFHVELENLEVNGVRVNWEDINHKINNDFNEIWPKAKTCLVQELENEVNNNLKGLSLEDILRILGA